jgi:AraC family ethanolamine operon transcriptional activator
MRMPMPHTTGGARTKPARHAPGWRNNTPVARLQVHQTAHDADEQAARLTAWQQRYDQISAGRFCGGLTELQLPQVQVFVETTSHALRQSCRVWPDAFWFGLAAEPTAPPTRINGRLNQAQGLMTRPGGQPFELVTPDNHRLYGVVVQRSWLETAAAAQGCAVDWRRLEQAEMLPISEGVRTDWLCLLSALLGGDAPACWPHASAVHLQELLACPLWGALDSADIDPGVRHSLSRRHGLVVRAQNLVLATPEQAPTVPQLCAELHLSRRTLQYCFEDVLGLSPMQAIRALRLNGARRALREAVGGGLGVQDVAAKWGFGHLSQFSTDYRRLFGETPSQTLRGERGG